MTTLALILAAAVWLDFPAQEAGLPSAPLAVPVPGAREGDIATVRAPVQRGESYEAYASNDVVYVTCVWHAGFSGTKFDATNAPFTVQVIQPVRPGLTQF